MNVLANSTCPLLLCILGIIVGAVYGARGSRADDRGYWVFVGV